jgi:hypothetical protein
MRCRFTGVLSKPVAVTAATICSTGVQGGCTGPVVMDGGRRPVVVALLKNCVRRNWVEK